MSKKICIAFRHGGIIPAAVLGTEEDKKLNAHEPFEVPAAYGKSLIEDRFAYAVEPEKKKGREKPAEDVAKAAAIDAAQRKVDDAKTAVAAADIADKAAAEAALADAERDLAAAAA